MGIRPTMTFALLAFAALAGCSQGTPAGSASIYVKDAPLLGFDEVHVVFTKVQVELEEEEGESGDDLDENAEGEGLEDEDLEGDDGAGDEEDEQEREEGQDEELVTLFDDPAGVDVDLLAANGTKAAFLGEADLAPRGYDEILVTVSGAYGVRNGTRVDFVLDEDVVELEHAFTVGVDRETRLVVDFDLADSLRWEAGEWHLDLEVLEVEDEDVDDDESGDERDEDEGEIRDLEDEDGGEGDGQDGPGDEGGAEDEDGAGSQDSV